MADLLFCLLLHLAFLFHKDGEIFHDDMKARDQRDSTRALSPLTPARDAKIIDSSYFNAEEVFSLAKKFIDSQSYLAS